MKPIVPGAFLLIAMSAFAASAFGLAAEVEKVRALPQGNEVRIEVNLSKLVIPKVRELGNPGRLIIDFPGASLGGEELLALNRNGVYNIHVGAHTANPNNTRIVIGVDSIRPYSIETSANTFVLKILSPSANQPAVRSQTNPRPTNATNPTEQSNSTVVMASLSPVPQVEVEEVEFQFDDAHTQPADNVRRSFRIKYTSGNNAYIDGGSNDGLVSGMELDISRVQSHTNGTKPGPGRDGLVGSVRVIGVATASAVTEVIAEDRAIRVGDAVELTPQDAQTAAARALQASSSAASQAAPITIEEESDPSGDAPGVGSNRVDSSRVDSSRVGSSRVGSSFARSSQKSQTDEGTGIAGRIGFDSSAITSTGSTPGTSMQNGISFQSDMTNILGTHWNLQGYWRGRVNRYNQLQQPTIRESLNKTYTMQLYYDNPDGKWVAGVGRLYLPWAASLDTIDGGYLGRKSAFGMTTGIFAGSTPDSNSWHYRPNQRIGGSFVNFTGGDFEKVHFSSTSGVGLNTVGWKTDRPFAFIENELSYKSKLSLYHSLIADSLHGISTNGVRLGPGVSHSYFTAHYYPARAISFDLYHNYFRDIPTATTAIVGTGLVDQLLFQGISGGVHLKPTNQITLYSSLGASERTGDSHRSLNQNYGGSWSEIAHTGFRADLHYSKFDSNFGKGDYRIASLSRQVTNRAFWNFQIGRQNLISQYTTNHNATFIADSMDVNIGRRSYLQSGYTFVKGATLNYREWYFSWGLRIGKVKTTPVYAQSVGAVH